jgi:PHD/YefM family antitoxin component YafN of YafNO toxin-antitoxin module
MTRIVSVTEFERNVTRFQEEAKSGPVTIGRDGQPETVLISADLYELIVKGRIARSVADLDDDTVSAIRDSEMPPGYEHLDDLLGAWKP